MEALGSWNWSLDGWIVAAGVLCAVAAALPGNFLVLRRMSMLGDAISHAVLPGLAAAFFMTGSRSSWPMFAGAIAVGVLTAVLSEWIRKLGRVDEGASMGVVFTSLFALGLVMIVQAADHVDLDPGCVLYGAIELTPLDRVSWGGFEVPRAVAMLGLMTVVNLVFVLFFYKELKLSSFDPALARASGRQATLMHYLLMVLVAATAVASFESVGNILVVAMFVVPPAAAYLLTDRLPWMIALSVVLAAASAVLGHIAALVVPAWFGYRSTTTSGMMAVSAGLLLALALTCAPRHGVLVKWWRRRLLAWRILAEDVIALLYRGDERSGTHPSALQIRTALLADQRALGVVLWWLQTRGLIARAGEQFQLTARGRAEGQALVRTHRLWEHYLVEHAGVDAQRIHDKAESFEHFTDIELRQRLDDETNRPTVDPHGKPIPGDPESNPPR